MPRATGAEQKIEIDMMENVLCGIPNLHCIYTAAPVTYHWGHMRWANSEEMIQDMKLCVRAKAEQGSRSNACHYRE